MSAKIKFKYKDKDYTLEYNRYAIKVIEKQGFNAEKFTEQPMTMVELAFEGAFIMNHAKITTAEVEEIYSLFKNKRALINQLIVMIQEAYSTLFDEDEEDNSKNIDWKAE
jgi:hypothetical protein